MPSEKRLRLAFKALEQRDVHIRWQHPIAGFYLDFYCAKAKLALEVDGKSHDWSDEHDAQRDTALRTLGITTLRVNANEVRENADGIARWFTEECRARLSK